MKMLRIVLTTAASRCGIAQSMPTAAVMVKDIEHNDNEGIGKPEDLEHGFQGYWSRRITDEHRLIYKVSGGEIRIAACRYHYSG